ncbi:unnamed protein product [Amoebophrya sp. A25]|nr:unnamed protein product [Amoebophrya sp. A25]|eukprot:GSA25T00013054001.1
MTVEEALFSDPSGARGAADSVLSICPAGRETTQEVAESPCSDGSKRTNDCLFSEERVQNDSDSTGAVAAESETSPPGKTKFSHPAFPRASSSRLLHSRMVQMLRRGTAPAAARRQKSNSQASTSSSVYGSSSSSSGGRGDFMNVSRWSTGCRSSSVRNVKQRITGIPEHAPIVAWKNVNICYGENSTVASDLVRGLLEACSRAARRDRRATLSSRMSSARQSAASSELQGWRHTKSDSSRTSGLSRLSESLRLRRSRTQKIYVEIPVQDLLVSSVINTTSDSPGAAEKDLLSPSEDEGTTRENLISKRQGKSLASVFSETASRKSYGEKTESVLVSCNPRLVRSWQDDVDTYAAISLFIALDGFFGLHALVAQRFIAWEGVFALCHYGQGAGGRVSTSVS